MTVRINKKALNLREELTKAQGVVRYEQRQFWMDGLVENGTFDTADGWTLGTGWSISGGKLNFSSGVAYQTARATISTKIGKKYKFLYTVDSISSGSFHARAIATPYEIIQANNFVASTGDGSVTFTAKSETSYIDFHANQDNVVIVLDNVAVFEVDENDNVIHSVPLGFKPVHVYEDGLLQREGTNHDYTVVNTGFGYQVKPTVAPSATTETCIIAEREL